MKLPSILSSTMSRDYTLADVYDEKHRHVEDAQSTSIETPLGGTIIRPFVSKRLCRAYLILLPIVFGLGIVLGCTSLSFFKRPEFVPGLRLRTPIPKEIFQQRLKIPFVPDNRYYGSGDAVDKAWKEITSGKPVCSYYTRDKCGGQKKTNFQPAGGDSIWLQNPSDYGLAKGISDPLNIDNTDERFYVLSNLHQLHCVVSHTMISEESHLWCFSKAN